MKASILLACFLLAGSQSMADCLTVIVEEYHPVGEHRYSVAVVAGPVNLDANIESLVVVNAEQRDVDTIDASGKRITIKKYYYFVSVVLDATGYTNLKTIQSALDKPNRPESRGVRVRVNDSAQGQRFWLDHRKKKAHLRLVLHEEQLYPLLKVVRKPWKDNPKGNSTINDWEEGRGIAEDGALVE